MTFLNKLAHDTWLEEGLPKIAKDFHKYRIAVNTLEKSDYFPIIDSVHNITKAVDFRFIIKLTFDSLPETIFFSEEDKSFFSKQSKIITYQIILIQVDKELNNLNFNIYNFNTLSN